MAYALHPREPAPAYHFKSEAPQLRGLTHRQREVFWLLSYGESNKGIARRMDVCEATVKAYISAILHATGCTNRTQAALIGLALREGLPTHGLKRS
jgi:DNA-binding NarL/FixJ family response regulator